MVIDTLRRPPVAGKIRPPRATSGRSSARVGRGDTMAGRGGGAYLLEGHVEERPTSAAEQHLTLLLHGRREREGQQRGRARGRGAGKFCWHRSSFSLRRQAAAIHHGSRSRKGESSGRRRRPGHVLSRWSSEIILSTSAFCLPGRDAAPAPVLLATTKPPRRTWPAPKPHKGAILDSRRDAPPLEMG